MTSGTTFEPGSIVLIPYPYSDLTNTKKRPVLALSGPDRFGDFVGLAITSNPSHDHALQISNLDLLQGHLPKTSWVRTDKLFTLESSLVLKQIAMLSPAATRMTRDRLCDYLGCERGDNH